MALRIPLSWLQDYVDLEQDPVKLAEALTISGTVSYTHLTLPTKA